MQEPRNPTAELDDDTTHQQNSKHDTDTPKGEHPTVQAVVADQNTPLLTRLVW